MQKVKGQSVFFPLPKFQPHLIESSLITALKPKASPHGTCRLWGLINKYVQAAERFLLHM